METEADFERLALLAAHEEESEAQRMRTALGADRVRTLEQLLAECEQDRAARLENMHKLDALLVESERIRAAYGVVLERQAAILLSVRYTRALAHLLRQTRRVALVPYRVVQRMGRQRERR